jgi:hypothetical protein
MPNQAEAAPVRGLLLIGVAVLIGALFLSKGFDTDDAAFSASGLPSTDETVPSGVGTGTETSDTSEVIEGTGTQTTQVPVGELPVLVVNASNVAGAAAAVTAQLTAAGYTAAIPPSGAAPTPTDLTFVYFYADATKSFQGDAEQVAATLGVQPTQVAQMPADLGVDIGAATVVVWLGPDIAPQA